MSTTAELGKCFAEVALEDAAEWFLENEGDERARRVVESNLAAIREGDRQVDRLCELRPQHAEKYREQHERNRDRCVRRIRKVLKEYGWIES